MPDNVKSRLDNEHKEFSDILNDIEGISNRMLSKELKGLELNLLVKRTVLDKQPITAQYELSGICILV